MLIIQHLVQSNLWARNACEISSIPPEVSQSRDTIWDPGDIRFMNTRVSYGSLQKISLGNSMGSWGASQDLLTIFIKSLKS